MQLSCLCALLGRLSETGAAFLVDTMSKHAMHSGCAEQVRRHLRGGIWRGEGTHQRVWNSFCLTLAFAIAFALRLCSLSLLFLPPYHPGHTRRRIQHHTQRQLTCPPPPFLTAPAQYPADFLVPSPPFSLPLLTPLPHLPPTTQVTLAGEFCTVPNRLLSIPRSLSILIDRLFPVPSRFAFAHHSCCACPANHSGDAGRRVLHRAQHQFTLPVPPSLLIDRHSPLPLLLRLCSPFLLFLLP